MVVSKIKYLSYLQLVTGEIEKLFIYKNSLKKNFLNYFDKNNEKICTFVK